MGSNVRLDGLVVGVYRTKQRLSMTALAQRAGITARTLGNIEHGRLAKTHRSTAEAIAQALRVPLEHLLVPDASISGHGTLAGYEQHLGDDTPICTACRDAWVAAWQAARDEAGR